MGPEASERSGPRRCAWCVMLCLTWHRLVLRQLYLQEKCDSIFLRWGPGYLYWSISKHLSNYYSYQQKSSREKLVGVWQLTVMVYEVSCLIGSVKKCTKVVALILGAMLLAHKKICLNVQERVLIPYKLVKSDKLAFRMVRKLLFLCIKTFNLVWRCSGSDLGLLDNIELQIMMLQKWINHLTLTIDNLYTSAQYWGMVFSWYEF